MTNRHAVPDAARPYEDADQFRSAPRPLSAFDVPASSLRAEIAAASPHMDALLTEADAAAGARIAADLVRRMREAAGLSQTELARRAGRAQSEVSDIERATGRVGPSVGLLCVLADAAGMELVFRPRPRAEPAPAPAPYDPFSQAELEQGARAALKMFVRGHALSARVPYVPSPMVACFVRDVGAVTYMALDPACSANQVAAGSPSGVRAGVTLPTFEVGLDDGTTFTFGPMAVRKAKPEPA